MPFDDYKHQDKPIKLWKAIKPERVNLFRSIVAKPFKFVEFHIKTSAASPNIKEESLMLWAQAEDFYNSSDDISIYSKPLTNYYSIMNAVKALLVFKGISFSPYHGVTRLPAPAGAGGLEAECLNICDDKIAGTLYKYLDVTHTSSKAFSLKELFYSIPFSHRAFLQIFTDDTDYYLPVKEPRFSRVDGNIHLTAKCTIENLTYARAASSMLDPNSGFTLRTLPDGDYLVGPLICSENLSDFDINREIINKYLDSRKYFSFIEGERTLWYYRGPSGSYPNIKEIPLPVSIFAISHKLSEMSRYHPLNLKTQLNSNHGWMIHEFIDSSLEQFIAYISCEICGKELARPKIR